MSHREGRSIGLALLLAAGVVAVVVTAGLLLSPTGVGAHPCDDFERPTSTPAVPDVHVDPLGNQCSDDSHDDGGSINHAALSSTEPGALVEIKLTANSESAGIPGNGEITVDFSGPFPDSGFVLPTISSTTRTRIKIDPDPDSATDDSFNPSAVRLEGEGWVLTIPSDESIGAGEYTILSKKRPPHPPASGIPTTLAAAK